LQPPERIEGRFAAAERLPGGWFEQGNDSIVSTAGGVVSNRPGLHPLAGRDSFDSNFSAATSNNSVYMPRRVESIMGEEDRKKYAMAQASQRIAGGAYMTRPPPGQIYEISESDLKKAGWKDSVESVASGERSPDAERALEAGTSVLALPPSSSTGQNARSGRSPLARVSLIRTVSSDGAAMELEDQTQQSAPTRSPGLSPQQPGPSREVS
jgi:chitin synthase